MAAVSHKTTRRVPLRDAGNDLEDFQLPSKAKKPRFADPKSVAEMETLGKGLSVPNTEKNTAWALRVFGAMDPGVEELEEFDAIVASIPRSSEY